MSVDVLMAKPMLQLAGAHLGLGVDPPASLLEVGCGYGLRTASLDTSGVHLVGVDIDLEKLSAEGASPHTTFVCGNCEQLPLGDRSVDALLSFSVLQYVDWRRAVAEARRVLSDGAPAVFIENLRHNPFTSVYRRLHREMGVTYAGYRTPRLHLSWPDVNEIGWTFAIDGVSVFHLLTPLSYALPLVNGRLQRPPTAVDRVLYRTLRSIDSMVLRTPARRLGWMVVIRAHAR